MLNTQKQAPAKKVTIEAFEKTITLWKEKGKLPANFRLIQYNNGSFLGQSGEHVFLWNAFGHAYRFIVGGETVKCVICDKTGTPSIQEAMLSERCNELDICSDSKMYFETNKS
ncbi:hypothetical protein HMPREF3034_00021 [Prevotella sp. DNF00663]|uniref:hypothetical protein n=1 Tax=Prevotella sp. DNF00663 TaxID=1384078 RepID=UPI000784ED39|nr:hypothetical protein [Prevotella sp. DNF00663]KXB86073.1 hypothetical protein HMPREF3034_00021 [Prevotella sp. DNF00663]